MSVHENCATCNTDYDITSSNAKLILFLNYLRASHVEADCTNCGAKEIIYVTTHGFMQILAECHLGVSFGLDPTPERREACDITWGNAENPKDDVVYTSETPVEIDPPHWMLRELFDELRDYEGTN